MSDNTASVCPEILAALAAVNHGRVNPYGDDEWTARLDRAFSDYFGAEVRAFVVTTGTAANALALAVLCPPYGAIFAHQEAHLETDECGAPGFFTGGGQLMLLPGEHGRIAPTTLAAALAAHPTHLHSVQAAVLSLSQATELGTAYRAEAVAELARIAHGRGLKVHMDGARFANVVAHLDCHPGDVTWRAGVDVLSFGATKNGAMGAEAVVFFRPELVRDFELHRKRSAHLHSKSRYVAAQLLAYLDGGLWKRNAQRANAFAQRVARAAGEALVHPVEANEVFVRLGAERARALRAAGFEFYDWGAPDSGEARLVVSWDQPEEEVRALERALGG
ncbi:MAG TPA: beta-eliminating lyase-related protein [Steroidobacteraceae bacterium]|jgi:threonine aldolase|nr:beta-eliminating lyase-related protein [Steroidobacteraceae bacterium]